MELVQAATEGLTAECERLLLAGSDPIYKTEDGNTALRVAAVNSHTETCEMLLKFNANVNAATKDGLSALHKAARYDHTETCEMLLKYNANVNAPTKSGFTALHTAARYDHTETCDMLLKYNADVNAATKYGLTPLHGTVRYDNTETCEILLKYNADVNATTKNGLTALHTAARYDHTEICEMLLMSDADVNAATMDGSTPLHSAAESGNTETCEILLKNNADVNVVTEDGYTPLHGAARYDYTETCDTLLKYNADVNAATEGGFTALHEAAKYNHTETCQMLLKYNADVNAATKEGFTALHGAASNGHTETCEILLKYNADVKAATKGGYTALHNLAANGHTETCEMLLKYNADVNAATKDGLMALHYAAGNGHTDTCLMLLKNNADVNAATKGGLTALHMAAKYDNADACEMLLKYNANLNAVTKQGDTALHLAEKQRNSLNTCTLLIGADLVSTRISDDVVPITLPPEPDHTVLKEAQTDMQKAKDKEWIGGHMKQQSAILDHRSQTVPVPDTNVRLEIPEGAIPVGDEVDVTITVHLDEHNQPPLKNKDFVIGPSVCIQPHGKVFLKPVTVTIPHSASNITSENITVWTKTSELVNQWDILFNGADETHRDDKSKVHVTDKSIKIRVTHFSWIATLLSYLTGPQQTLQMEMRPFMQRPQVKEPNIVYLRVYALREDQAKNIKDDEEGVNGVKCGEMTPFAFYVNGENISCRIRMIEQEDKWRLEEEQKELLYEQIQQGKYVKCTFAFKKLDANVEDIHGLISANQAERRLFIDSTFGTMCIAQKKDNQAAQPHHTTSRLQLQTGPDQAAGPNQQDSGAKQQHSSEIQIYGTPPESVDSHQRQHSTPGYHMRSTSAENPVHQDRELYHGMSGLQLQRRDTSTQQQPRMYEMPTSSSPDSLASRRYEQSASGYLPSSERLSRGAGPMSLNSGTLQQRNTASAAAASAAKGATSLRVQGVDNKSIAFDSRHVRAASLNVSNEPLLQSLQPFKPKERGSLSNPFLEIVARGIHLQWRDLAARLGFSDDDCDEFSSGDNAPGAYWPAFRMLDRFRETISDTEALNGRAILADTIKTLNTNLYEKIVEMV